MEITLTRDRFQEIVEEAFKEGVDCGSYYRNDEPPNAGEIEGDWLESDARKEMLAILSTSGDEK